MMNLSRPWSMLSSFTVNDAYPYMAKPYRVPLAATAQLERKLATYLAASLISGLPQRMECGRRAGP